MKIVFDGVFLVSIEFSKLSKNEVWKEKEMGQESLEIEQEELQPAGE